MVDGGNHARCSGGCGPDSTLWLAAQRTAGHKLLVCEPLANPAWTILRILPAALNALMFSRPVNSLM